MKFVINIIFWVLLAVVLTSAGVNAFTWQFYATLVCVMGTNLTTE